MQRQKQIRLSGFRDLALAAATELDQKKGERGRTRLVAALRLMCPPGRQDASRPNVDITDMGGAMDFFERPWPNLIPTTRKKGFSKFNYQVGKVIELLESKNLSTEASDHLISFLVGLAGLGRLHR